MGPRPSDNKYPAVITSAVAGDGDDAAERHMAITAGGKAGATYQIESNLDLLCQPGFLTSCKRM